MAQLARSHAGDMCSFGVCLTLQQPAQARHRCCRRNGVNRLSLKTYRKFSPNAVKHSCVRPGWPAHRAESPTHQWTQAHGLMQSAAFSVDAAALHNTFNVFPQLRHVRRDPLRIHSATCKGFCKISAILSTVGLHQDGLRCLARLVP